MSKKQFLKRIMTDGVMTSTNTLTSTEFEVGSNAALGIQFVWTGSSVSGTLSCQVSNDSGTTWSTFTVTLPTISASNGGNGIAAFVDFPYQKIRFRYVNSSGSGVMNMYLCGKEN
jgi:hypothetical protein